MIKVEESSIARITSPELSQRVDEVRERWQSKTYEDICRETEEATSIAPTEDSAGIVVLEPQTKDVDETQSLAIAFPYQNAWWPHHYVRARVAQQIIAPNSRTLVLPNNSIGEEFQYYDLDNLSDEDVARMESGSVRPVVEQQVRTLERYSKEQSLGQLMVTGYSFGGRIAIEMASMGKRDIEIVAVNADEMPSQGGRSKSGLRDDFLKSNKGPAGGLRQAAQSADIPALASAMRRDRMLAGRVRFGLSTLTRSGKLTHAAMTGSMIDRIIWTNHNHPDLPIKLGHIAGSHLFNPDYLDENRKRDTFVQKGVRSLHVVKYDGRNLQSHASGDNPFVHALTAYDGLINTPNKLAGMYHMAKPLTD